MIEQITDQRELWNKQHAVRGTTGRESNGAAHIPNESAILFHRYLAPVSTIFEAGCANGRDARFWAAQGHYVIASDFSPVALTQMMELATDAGIEKRIRPVEHNIANGLQLAENESINGFYARSALHINDAAMDNLAGNLQESLTPGGIIFIEGKNTSDHKIGRSEKISENLVVDFMENGHLRRIWTPEYMEKLASDYDWNILKLEENREEGANYTRLIAKSHS